MAFHTHTQIASFHFTYTQNASLHFTQTFRHTDTHRLFSFYIQTQIACFHFTYTHTAQIERIIDMKALKAWRNNHILPYTQKKKKHTHTCYWCGTRDDTRDYHQTSSLVYFWRSAPLRSESFIQRSTPSSLSLLQVVLNRLPAIHTARPPEQLRGSFLNFLSAPTESQILHTRASIRGASSQSISCKFYFSWSAR